MASTLPSFLTNEMINTMVAQRNRACSLVRVTFWYNKATITTMPDKTGIENYHNAAHTFGLYGATFTLIEPEAGYR